MRARRIPLANLFAIGLVILVIVNSLFIYSAVTRNVHASPRPSQRRHVRILAVFLQHSERGRGGGARVETVPAPFASVRSALLMNVSLAVVFGFVLAVGSLWRTAP